MLALLVPGLLMGGGTAAEPSAQIVHEFDLRIVRSTAFDLTICRQKTFDLFIDRETDFDLRLD